MNKTEYDGKGNKINRKLKHCACFLKAIICSCDDDKLKDYVEKKEQ